MAMESKFSNFNLTMLNLWIGLCRGVAGLPKALRKLDYKDKWIEWKFTNQDREVVLPDLLIASEKMGHTLLLEFKSGANTEPDQLNRYSRVTQDDLRRKAFISLEATLYHDVSIVGKNEHGERLRMGITGGDHQFPLLLVDEDGLLLGYGNFQLSELDSLFSPRLDIDWEQVPYGFVPVNEDSKPWEIAEVVMPIVLRYMTERRPSARVPDICQDICTTWGIMGTPARDQTKSKVRNVLHEAARQHFKPYLRWVKPMDGVEIVANPLDLKPDKRTTEYRKLRRAQEHFIEDLRVPGQQLNFDL